jgi:SPP1 gp7 family putative phage head morphogenesis protein
MAINDDIYDKNLYRRILLTKYEKNLSDKLDDILVKHNINLRDIAGSSAKYNTTLKLRIDAEIRRTYRQLYNKANEELNRLYTSEAKFNETVLDTSLSGIYDVKRVSKNVTVKEFILRDNKTLGQHMTSISIAERKKITSIIRVGITKSLGTPEIIRQIKNVGTSLSRSQVSTLARTAITDVANEASKDVYKANDDVIEGYQYVATLDDRTTPICARLDGKIFTDFDGGPRPPQHFNCRSTTIPVLKSIDDIADLDSNRVDNDAIDNLSDRKRASINGQVPARTTYAEWIQGQSDEVKEEVLGKDNVDIFNAGKLPLDKFITPKGNPVSIERLDELSNKETLKGIDAIATKIPGQDIKLDNLEILSLDKVKEKLSATIKEGLADNRYNSVLIYRGSEKQVGKINLGKLEQKAASATVAIFNELNTLAARYNVPKLRGIAISRSNKKLDMAMGDGVLIINPKNVNNYYKETSEIVLKDRELASKFKLGNDVSKEFNGKITRENYLVAQKSYVRPWTGDAYFTDPVDHHRYAMYHEFGHQVHQQKFVTNTGIYKQPIVENKLITELKFNDWKRTGATRYSSSDPLEWFAENFALLHMGRKDLVAKEFIKFMEDNVLK